MLDLRVLAWLSAVWIVFAGRAAGADPPAVETKHGMVVAAEPLAAEAGVEMLRRGGNAIDAAVATGFALAVTYPVAGNLGGGGFLLAVLPANAEEPEGAPAREPRRIALDFRETAPALAHPRLFVEAKERGVESASTLGHLAAGVPGSVAGLLHALEQWGSLDRATVLAPAIRLAHEGFAVPRRTADFLRDPDIAAGMRSFESTADLFYPGGEPLAEGALLRQPDLARTLERIATQGRSGFYSGETAERIVAEMARGGGIVSRSDLLEYQPVERPPIEFAFHGVRLVTMPPPSSGGVCLQQMLAILDRFPLRELGHNSSATLHLLAEAMRRSFADRNRFLGDPDDQALPLAELRSARRLDALASTIRLDLATPSETLLDTPLPSPEGEQTTHYSVVDAWGGAVSVTTTLNGAFGSKVLVPGAGFLLNNEMDDFTTHPGQPNLYGLVQGAVNDVRAGRRPLSSMTPTIVLDDRGVRHVLGTPGGPTIITNVLQVFLALEVFDLEPQAAVNSPKIHHQCLPDRIDIEPGLPLDVWDGLRRRGHAVRERESIGDFQLISRRPERGLLLGASDPRGGGAVRGY
ncbi:MAG: gamma-glutamyltransferase [Planctomycetes bacterium]|nr:gamma-glutamyltransferase [Planctomycetota bacterium]